MAITATKSGGNFELVPQGQYTARCYRVIDLGTQENEWQGEKYMSRKVMLFWELLKDSDGERPTPEASDNVFTMLKEYTLSFNENSNLYQDVTSWLGKELEDEEYNVDDLLGKYAQLQVMHKTIKQGKNAGKKKAIVNGLFPHTSKTKPKAENKDELFEVESPDMDVMDNLPEFVQNKIKYSQEWRNRNSAKEAITETFGEDVEEVDDSDNPLMDM